MASPEPGRASPMPAPMMASRATAGLGIGMAACLCWLGFAPSVSAILRLPGEEIIGNPPAVEQRTADELRQAIASLAAANTWSPESQPYDLMGLAAFEITGRAAGGRLDPAILADAIRDFRRGIERAPADTSIWAHLALSSLRQGDVPGAAKAFVVSMALAPASVPVGLWRCDMGFRLYGALDPLGRTLFRKQIDTAWRKTPYELVEIARRHNAQAIVRESFSYSPDSLVAFERILKETEKKK